MSINLDYLKKVAQAATQGPWEHWNPSEGPSHISIGHKVAWESKRKGQQYADDEPIPHWNDARHMAAFDPPTVLALIARIEELEAAIQRVRDLPIYEALDAYGDAYDVVAHDELTKALEGEPT